MTTWLCVQAFAHRIYSCVMRQAHVIEIADLRFVAFKLVFSPCILEARQVVSFSGKERVPRE